MVSFTPNISKIIGWTAENLTLSGSAFDDGNSKTTVLYIDDNNAVKSFQAGRPSFANTLTQLEDDRVYQVIPKSSITVPDASITGL